MPYRGCLYRLSLRCHLRLTPSTLDSVAFIHSAQIQSLSSNYDWHIACPAEDKDNRMSIFFLIRSAVVPAMALVLSVTVHGQSLQGTQSKPGKLIGTVTDANGHPVPNATIVLETPESNDRRTIVTPESGFFEFTDVKPATPYEINVKAKEFADWTSPAVTIDPGQFKI